MVVIIIGYLGGQGGDKKETAKTDDTTTKSSETSSNSKSETKRSTKESKSEAKTYTIGQDVTVGKVVYKINSKEVVDTVGTEYVNSTANAKYLVLDVTITNNGDEAITISDDFFKLYKGKTEFKSDSSASMYANQQAYGDSVSFFYSQLNPESTITGKVVFDVNEETINDPSTQIQVQTGVWGTETEKINLN